MSFLHFVNCLFLTFGPVLLVRRLLLNERGSWYFHFNCGLFYLLTHLAKFMILATVFSVGGGLFSFRESGTFEWVEELTRAAANSLDLVGLYYVVTMKRGGVDSTTAHIEAGLGWCLCESILSRVAVMWFSIRAWEFDWMYMLSAWEANVNMVLFLAVADSLRWWRRRKCDQQYTQNLAVAATVAYCLIPFIYDVGVRAFGLNSWALMVVRAVLTAAAALGLRQAASKVPMVQDPTRDIGNTGKSKSS